VVGDRRWPASERLRAELVEDGIAHQWLDPAEDAAARLLLAEAGADGAGRPVVFAPDGRVLVEPSREELLALAAAPRRDLTTS
jgi:hypothetical protein